MPQALNETQRLFVQETIRPALETLVKFKFWADAFVLEYANQQDPITADAEVLWDNEAHDGPRDGAPQLTGTRLSQLNTVVTNMQGQLDGPTLDIIVSLLVRDLNNVIGN